MVEVTVTLCHEVAWWTDDRKPVAVCLQPYGVEHSHGDYTASEAIAAEVARPVSDDDVFRVVESVTHPERQCSNRECAIWFDSNDADPRCTVCGAEAMT